MDILCLEPMCDQKQFNTTAETSFYIPKDDSVCTDYRIPKIIHRVWFVFDNKKADKSTEYTVNDNILRSLHPDWEIMEWDDNSAEKFVKENYPDFYPTYKSYDFTIKRHDSFRYLLMDYYGGIFIQHSFLLNKPLDALVCGADLVLSREERVSDIINNGFIASVPKHNFWSNMIGDYLIPKKNSYVLWATGPHMLKEKYYDYLKNSPFLENKTLPIRMLDHSVLFPFSWRDKHQSLYKEYCYDTNRFKCFDLFPHSFGFTPWNAFWRKQTDN